MSDTIPVPNLPVSIKPAGWQITNRNGVTLTLSDHAVIVGDRHVYMTEDTYAHIKSKKTNSLGERGLS